jgi:general secretion pathway protein J
MLGSYALNQSLIQYKSLAQKGFSFWQYAKVVWIDKSVGSMIDYYVKDERLGWYPYFKGDLNGFSYVSLSPFAGDFPSIVWVLKEKNEKGKYDLKYYELPVGTKNSRQIEDDFTFENYKKGNVYLIMKDVEEINFQYYGFDLSKRRYEWSNEFDGKLKKILPSAIMLSYKDEEGEKRLFLKINTNSMMKLIYNEIYK